MLWAHTDTEVHRLSYEDVLRMVETGVLREDDRVELVEGVLIDMTPPGADHSAIVSWLTRHFVAGAGEREVRVQDLLLIEGGFVMPDLMVIDPPPRGRHPSTAFLVVEVSVTTQRHDEWKAGRYAAAGVGEYWIVDVAARTVRVHRRPRPGGYEQVAAFVDGDRIGEPAVDVSELLGPEA
ncbi:MAG TPA: Uma2 family endonuclease [Thermoleophilaceae bacterium]|nr:Uma2 family endonuclease [Thermoleophilaceae bacterium]